MNLRLFKDGGAGTISVMVGNQTATVSIGEWSRLLSRPESADQMFSFGFPDASQANAFHAPEKDPA